MGRPKHPDSLAIGTLISKKMFEMRGVTTEIHLRPHELAVACAVAAENAVNTYILSHFELVPRKKPRR